METGNVARGTFQIAFTAAIEYLVMGLFYIVVTKTNALTPADLGVLSVLHFIQSALLLSTLALPTALTKFVSEHLGKNESQKAASVQRTLAGPVLVLSLTGLGIAVGLSAPLSRYFWGTTDNILLIILISISAFLLNMQTLYSSGLRALCLFGKMALVTVTYVFSSRVIAIIMALLDFGVLGVALGYIVGTFAGLVVAIAFIRGKLPNPSDKTPMKPLFQYSLPLFLSSLALLVFGQADIIVLASVTSDYTLVGVYSIAVRSLLALTVIWQPIMITIFPIVSARFSLENPEGVGNALKMTSRYLAYTIIPTCVLLAVVAPTALSVFYGPSYVSGAPPLAILAISIIVLALFTLFTTTLTAIGKTRQVLQINLVTALLTVTLLLSLVPIFGAVGAAVTRLTAQLIGLMLIIIVLRRYVNVQLDRDALWKSTLASLIITPFLFGLESVMTIRFPPVQVLAIEILIAGFIYLASLHMLKALNGQDFELLRQSFPKSFSKIIDVLQAVLSRK